jgi:hypothetical protein
MVKGITLANNLELTQKKKKFKKGPGKGERKEKREGQ